MTRPEAVDGLPFPRRYAAILALSCASAVVVIDSSSATVALPTIARDLHVTSASAVSIVTVYQLVLVMLLLPFAGLGERFGLKRLYRIGLLVFTAGAALSFLAPSLPILLLGRAVQAAGAAAMLSISSALVRAIYPADQLGRGLAINMVVVSTSAILSPSLGGLVLALKPWPWVFASAVPFALLSLALGRALPTVPLRTERFDVLGAILCAITFGLVIGGLQSAVMAHHPALSTAVGLAGVLVGLLFVRRERGAAKPILPIDLLGRPVMALSVGGSFCAFVAMTVLTLSMPFRLQNEFGYTPSEVGVVTAAWPFAMMITGPMAGGLSDRYPAGVLGGIGMILACIGMVSIALTPPHPGWFDIVWRMGISGAGFGLFLAPNARLLIGSAPPERAAAAGGLMATNRLLGQTIGATVVAGLLALGLAGTTAPLVSAGLAFVAGVCSLARLRPSLSESKG